MAPNKTHAFAFIWLTFKHLKAVNDKYLIGSVPGQFNSSVSIPSFWKRLPEVDHAAVF
jgi:hypothetical protein